MQSVAMKVPAPTEQISNEEIKSDAIQVPQLDPTFVPWGENFQDIKTIIESGQFYPTWVTGHTGNGKTKFIEQACACAGLDVSYYDLPKKDKEPFTTGKIFGRKFIRINFTAETDENDLLGGIKLKDGNSPFELGPVALAMLEGAILLLDEIDAGHSNRVLTLQSILEGNGVLLKSENRWIKPAHGFNIFATSNTKGSGSEDGRYIGTSIMNKAFLDRFPSMIEQTYPDAATEEKILRGYFGAFRHHMPRYKTYNKQQAAEEFQKEVDWMAILAQWAKEVRDEANGVSSEETITTRTLINIVKGYSIFDNRDKAIKMALNRYDEDTTTSFMEFYTKLVPAKK